MEERSDEQIEGGEVRGLSQLASKNSSESRMLGELFDRTSS